jgi:hypothetical protein
MLSFFDATTPSKPFGPDATVERCLSQTEAVQTKKDLSSLFIKQTHKNHCLRRFFSSAKKSAREIKRRTPLLLSQDRAADFSFLLRFIAVKTRAAPRRAIFAHIIYLHR